MVLVRLVFYILILLPLVATNAIASSGNRIQKLDWSKKSEVLEYHSCGCADSCWIAELKNKRTKKVMARLRCNCEKIFSLSPRSKDEVIFRADCKMFEGMDKLDVITSEIKKLMNSKGD
jgi:hypothetical protein